MSGLNPPAAALDRPAIIERDGILVRHGELLDAIRSVAAQLHDSSKRLIACACERDLESIVAFRAALDANAAVLLLDGGMDDSQLAKIVDLYEPEVLTGVAPDRLQRITAEAAYASAEIAFTLGRPRRLAIASRRAPATSGLYPDLAVLLSTSGSTGSPKLVRLRDGSLEANARSIIASLGITADDRAVATMSFAYSYGLSVLNTHLLAGASIVLAPELTTLDRAFWDLVGREEVTSYAGVPYAYQLLERIGFERFELPALRTMTQAGGKLANGRIEAFHRLMTDRGGRFFVMYGQTEATARIACLPSEWLPAKLGSAGRAIPGGRLEIDGESSSGSGDGEVVYSGPNVMFGYAHERADLARGDELGGRLRTGDLGRLDEDGCVYLSGRAKRIAKLFGFRVNLDEVEAMIGNWGPAAVVARDDRLLVFCETRRSGDRGGPTEGDGRRDDRDVGALARHLRIPRSAIEVRPVDLLPRGTNGKLDYGELLQLA